MPAPPRPGFVYRTHQAGRLRAAWVVSMAGSAAILVDWFWLEPPRIWVGMGGALVFLVGFVWQCVSVRCPQCATAVVWYTFNHRGMSTANVAIWQQPVCPKCGYDPP
jgi:hypothetical protein